MALLIEQGGELLKIGAASSPFRCGAAVFFHSGDPPLDVGIKEHSFFSGTIILQILSYKKGFGAI